MCKMLVHPRCWSRGCRRTHGWKRKASCNSCSPYWSQSLPHHKLSRHHQISDSSEGHQSHPVQSHYKQGWVCMCRCVPTFCTITYRNNYYTVLLMVTVRPWHYTLKKGFFKCFCCCCIIKGLTISKGSSFEPFLICKHSVVGFYI